MTQRSRLLLLLCVAALLAVAAASLVQPDLSPEELMAAYAGDASRFLGVDGMNVHYRDEGTGKTLVLLHGSGSSLHTWDGWVDSLGDEIRIIRLDLPGFGLTGPRPDNDYRVTRYVRFLHAFLARLDVERFSLAGNSLAGFIAWCYALEHPAQVEKLVLIDAGGYPSDDPFPLVYRLARTPVLGRLLMVISARALVERSLEEVYADDGKVTNALVERYYRLSLRSGNRTAFVARANTPMEDRFDELESLDLPVLLMWGGRDAWSPVQYVEKFQRKLVRARVRVYPDLGHAPMEEAPTVTSADARAFLLDEQS